MIADAFNKLSRSYPESAAFIVFSNHSRRAPISRFKDLRPARVIARTNTRLSCASRLRAISPRCSSEAIILLKDYGWSRSAFASFIADTGPSRCSVASRPRAEGPRDGSGNSTRSHSASRSTALAMRAVQGLRPPAVTHCSRRLADGRGVAALNVQLGPFHATARTSAWQRSHPWAQVVGPHGCAVFMLALGKTRARNSRSSSALSPLNRPVAADSGSPPCRTGRPWIAEASTALRDRRRKSTLRSPE